MSGVVNPMSAARATVRLHVGEDPESFDAFTLQWMANGPLHDAVRAFCPCGRLTLAQAKAREAAQIISEERR